MLHIVGTVNEACRLESLLPERVFTELVRGLVILDCEYGENRNYHEDGGYSLIAETAEDIQAVKKYVDFEFHPCEWAVTIGKDTGYLCALFIMNDDFSIMLYLPAAIAPDAILRELD